MKKTGKNKSVKGKEGNIISRKAAIKKIGLTALSAATMMILLNEPAKAEDTSDSPAIPPEWP